MWQRCDLPPRRTLAIGWQRSQIPTGCQTVFVSRNASIRRGSGGLAQSSSEQNTRFTLLAARRSRSARAPAGAPVRSIAFTSKWPASTGASSAVRPVRMLTTPPGTSEVASTSDSVMAGNGRPSLATITAALPVTITGATTLTSPSRLDSAGARTATTPVGSGTLKLKYGPATGLDAPATCATLSAQPAYQIHRSITAATIRRAVAAETLSAATTSSVNCAALPSIISPTRYNTCPRLYAVAEAHLLTAVLAATTASRTSFLEARAAQASNSPPRAA